MRVRWLSDDRRNGAWTYKVDNDQAEVQGLGADDVLTDTVTVTSLDGIRRRASRSRLMTQVMSRQTRRCVVGTDGDDVLIGDDNDDTLIGLDGDDIADRRSGDDTLDGGLGADILNGGAGDDVLISDPSRGLSDSTGSDFSSADYRDATGAITVTLSSESSVTGDVSVGTDTLIGIDRVFGSGFADTFTVDSTFSGNFGSFNEIEGGGGDDVITGNGKTRVGYLNADAGVFVDLGAGTARSIDEGDAANVGTDTFTGVRDVRGSQFGDTLVGSDGEGFENFRGMGGDDFIDGGAGDFDRADYRNSPDSVFVDLSAGIAQDGFGGTDTLCEHRACSLIGGEGGPSGDDTLIGDAGDNNLDGRAGDDTAGWWCRAGLPGVAALVRMRSCLRRRMARRGTCRVREAFMAILSRITRQARTGLSSRAWKGSATRAVSSRS